MRPLFALVHAAGGLAAGLSLSVSSAEAAFLPGSGTTTQPVVLEVQYRPWDRPYSPGTGMATRRVTRPGGFGRPYFLLVATAANARAGYSAAKAPIVPVALFPIPVVAAEACLCAKHASRQDPRPARRFRLQRPHGVELRRPTAFGSRLSGHFAAGQNRGLDPSA